MITLNKSHVAHGELFDTLQQDTSNMTPQQLQQQILKANAALMLMFIAGLDTDESSERQINAQGHKERLGPHGQGFLAVCKED